MSDCTQCVDYEWCAKNEECGMFKQKSMTNADRIRGMSDEELAEVLRLTAKGGIIGQRSKECWLSWLRKEASE